ncbi:MAG: hypothetical protein AAFZ65_00625 [Planctomycetota bacterium]
MKRLFKGLAISLATLVALTLALELGLRASGFEPIVNPMGPRWMYRLDPELGFALNPGFEGRHEHPEFATAIEIDARGFRDVAAGGEPRHRVLVLGDSMVFGFGVEAEETFCEVLQGDLGDVDVINAGTSGYGPKEQAVLLDRHLDALDPDAIVSSFFMANDLEDVARVPQTVRGGLIFSPDFAADIDRSPFRTFALERSRLALTLETKRVEALAGVRLGRPLEGLVPPGPDDLKPMTALPSLLRETPPEIEAAWAGVRACYAAMAERAGDRPLLVVYMPVLHDVDPGRWERQLEGHGIDPGTVDRDLPFARLAGICEELGLELIDPRPALTRDEGAWEFFFPYNQHLTVEGNRRLAEALRPAIERSLGR